MTTDNITGQTKQPDPARRPGEVARTLAQSALQATARAMHTAQLAMDAARHTGGSADTAKAMDVLRNALVDAYAGVPENTRRAILAAPGTIGGDELLDLLATLVAARNGHNNERAAGTVAK